MKLSCRASSLKHALSMVSSVLPARSPNEALGAVLVQAQDGAVALRGTDSSMEIKVSLEAQVQQEGDALVPAALLKEYVALAEGEVSLNVNERFQATLQGGGRKASILCLPPQSYSVCVPAFPAPSVFMEGSAFAQAIEGCAFCAGSDEARRSLISVNAVFSLAGKAEFASMDGYRLSIARQGCRAEKPLEMLFPVQAARLAAKLMASSSEIAIGGEQKKFCFVQGDGVSFVFPLLHGDYVDYSRFINRSETGRLILSPKDLLSAVKNANIAARFHQKEGVALEMKGDALLVSGISAQTEAVSALDRVQLRGSIKKIVFNGRYLEEALAHVPADQDVACVFGDSGVLPMRIVPQNEMDDRFCQVVMPVLSPGGAAP